MKPVEVSDVDHAFPADVIGKYLPKWEEIPDEYKKSHNPWADSAQRLFFEGGSFKGVNAKEGIDKTAAIRQVSACLRSFQPGHEHKIAGVAYLMASFFEAPPAPTK